MLKQGHPEVYCACASTLGAELRSSKHTRSHFMFRKHRRSCTVREEAHSELYVLAQAYKLSLA